MLSQGQKKFIRSLQQKKFRTAHNQFVAEGPKVVQELLQSPLRVDALYATENCAGSFPQAELISRKDLDSISGFKEPNGILAVANIPSMGEMSLDESLVLLLDSVRDPGNLGTILRVAEWFGLGQLILSPDCADVFNPKVVQSAMGSLFRMNVVTISLPKALEKLKSGGFQAAGAEMDGISIQEFNRPEKMALVMGSESHGISAEVQGLLDVSLTISKSNPTTPIDSLNVSMATGILLSALKA